MGSYLPGKKKLTYESCLVRGYWGDIVISPYIAMGVECDYAPEKELLFKIANGQQVGHSVEVTLYILQYFLQMLDKQSEYRMTFTDPYRKPGREKEIEKEKKEMDKPSQEVQPKQKQLENIKEETEAEETDQSKLTQDTKSGQDPLKPAQRTEDAATQAKEKPDTDPERTDGQKQKSEEDAPKDAEEKK